MNDFNYSKFNNPPSLEIDHGTDEVRGFSQLLILLSAFEYDSPHESLFNVLNAEVDRHCSKYPEDVTYLASILNVNIINKQ